MALWCEHDGKSGVLGNLRGGGSPAPALILSPLGKVQIEHVSVWFVYL